MTRTTATPTHTPTPWTVNGLGFIHSTTDPRIVVTEEPDEMHYKESHTAWPANAAHIVRCVNEREGLLQALREAARWMTFPNDEFQDEEYRDAVKLILNTLAHATQEEG